MQPRVSFHHKTGTALGRLLTGTHAWWSRGNTPSPFLLRCSSGAPPFNLSSIGVFMPQLARLKSMIASRMVSITFSLHGTRSTHSGALSSLSLKLWRDHLSGSLL